MNGQRVLHTRQLSAGRTEVLRAEADGIRLVRMFGSPAGDRLVESWFDHLRSLSSPGLLFPDRFARRGRGIYEVSIPADGLVPLAEPPEFGEASALLATLHALGLLHLDLASMPFLRGGGRLVLVVWGDGSLLRLPDHAPEIASGGFATPGADSRQLESICRSGAGEPARLPCGRAPESGPMPGPGLTVLTGGSWQSRDEAVVSWLLEARSRGWQARVFRCRPAEMWRPLPDRENGSPPVRSAADLLGCAFQGTSGVDRLLVLDSIEHASPDLLRLIGEITTAGVPNLRLAVTCSSLPAHLWPRAVVREARGDVSSAFDEIFSPTGKGWQSPCHYGIRRRSGDRPVAPGRFDVGIAAAEGGFSSVVEAWGMGLAPEGSEELVADCLLSAGKPAEALELIGGSGGVLEGRVLLALGRTGEAESVLRAAVDSGDGAAPLQLASLLAAKGDAAGSLGLLEGSTGIDALLLKSSVLDMTGSPASALEILDASLEGASSRDRCLLQISRTGLLMRLAMYGEALSSAEEAVSTARSTAEVQPLVQALRERGRVREVTGSWREALEDYRLAAFLAEESGYAPPRPVEVDMCVLESKMGLERDSEGSLARLEARAGTEIERLVLEMVRSHGAVLHAMGERGLVHADRGASIAAALGLPLMQGLCLLYRGGLLGQAGRIPEASESFRKARAIAGSLGDRHLMLLVDIARAEAGLHEDPARIPRAARALGLVPETLEATAIAGGDGAPAALAALLELPCPARACILARHAGVLREDLRSALATARRSLADSLGSSAQGFMDATSWLEPPDRPSASRRGSRPARDPWPELIGSGGAMTRLREGMARAASTDLPVLVTGGTGTGKELVARGIHSAGARVGGPFVPVDCGAIPESLMEAEFFGARKGAYTDLSSDRRGLLEAAAGGTLFLDELGNLPPMMQVKLLRAIESGRIRLLGEAAETPVSFRLIAATNIDPGILLAEGRLRPDLYYRVAVLVLRTPSLSERIEDIPLLASSFGLEASGERPTFTEGAIRLLQEHAWPGNVRELRNVIHRAAAMSGGPRISEEHLFFDPFPSAPGGATIEEAIARHVHSVLESAGGRVSRAAAILGCDPKTVRKYEGLYRRG